MCEDPSSISSFEKKKKKKVEEKEKPKQILVLSAVWVMGWGGCPVWHLQNTRHIIHILAETCLLPHCAADDRGADWGGDLPRSQAVFRGSGNKPDHELYHRRILVLFSDTSQVPGTVSST